MTPFEQLTDKLAAKGLTLRPQWEVKREQSVVRLYNVHGPKANVRQVIINHWPDGGYDSFLPPIVNSIEGDVALIAE